MAESTPHETTGDVQESMNKQLFWKQFDRVTVASLSHHQVVHHFRVGIDIYVEAELDLVSKEVAVLERLHQPRQRRQAVVCDHMDANLDHVFQRPT